MYDKATFNFCFLFLFAVYGVAQERPTNTVDLSGHDHFDTAIIDDTVTVKYFTLTDIDNKQVITDTLFDDFEKYAREKRFRTGSLNLGNLASSSLPIIYKPRQDILIDAGYHQYDTNKTNLHEFKFFQTGQPYNDLFFSPVSGKDNFLVKADFSANYANDYNISVNFRRASQQGFYAAQDTKTTNFGIGLWKKNAEKNHQLFITLLANNHNENHNGGIVPNTNNGIRDRAGEPTYLIGADGRHQYFSYSIDNFLGLGKSDKYKVHHQVQYERGYFRYSDQGNVRSQDSLIYGEPFITDIRGFRQVLKFSKWTNTVDISFASKAIDLSLGLKHQYAKFTPDKDAIKINDLFAFGRLGMNVGTYASLSAFGELGIGENIGNLNLDGRIAFKPVKGLTVSGKIKALRYDPSIQARSLSVSFVEVYNNDFEKVNEFMLGGELNWEKMNLTLEFNSGLINNPIAVDATAFPFQPSGSIEYIQGIVEHRLLYKFIGLENSIIYQSFSENLLNLPKLYGIHNAFVQFHLFEKNLLTRLGGLYYLMQTDNAVGFFPLTGQFIPTGQGLINLSYPYYELYGNFQINDFRLYLKLENANDLFQPGEYYQVAYYPQFDWKLRLGVRWVMKG